MHHCVQWGEAVVGGVWAKNDYPGLRLHAPGGSYRSFSLAPAWQREGEGKDTLSEDKNLPVGLVTNKIVAVVNMIVIVMVDLNVLCLHK